MVTWVKEIISKKFELCEIHIVACPGERFKVEP